jgi:16S rRNA (cytosine1402-N4)-methyltransferase
MKDNDLSQSLMDNRDFGQEENLSDFCAHHPVMLKEVMDIFFPLGSPGYFLDATFGRGGHTRSLLNCFTKSQIFALDQDPDAISYAQTYMKEFIDEGRLHIIQARFSQIDKLFAQPIFSGILFDLGLSSPQVNCAERGFSFLKDGPLDMRMSQQGKTAQNIIAMWNEKELADLFFQYGQEGRSRRIARAIVAARAKNPLKTTGQLAEVVKRAVPYYRHKHPATKVFQALRIYINDELSEIEKALPMACDVLKPGGRMVVISFHSLEDKIAKTFFKSEKRFAMISKKPLKPGELEAKDFPSARSACLRFGVSK